MASRSQQQSAAPSVNGQPSISQQPTTSLSTPPVAGTPQRGKLGFSGRTAWDWLQLLIIPVILAGVGLWFTAQQNSTSLQVSKQQHQTDLQIAADQQREAALQSYLDHMADLLLNYKLQSNPSDTIREVATVRTLTVLPRLDSVRKGVVVKFLYQAGLIGRDPSTSSRSYGFDIPIINLNGADLSGVDLSGFIFDYIDLNRANLSRANLSGTGLCQADLLYADLDNADLRFTGFLETRVDGVNFKHANLDFADLGGTDITQAQLEQAKSHKSPNGQTTRCSNGGG